MPEATLLGDNIQPAWQALTPEQRTCWHFWAATHPQLDAFGNLQTLYGQQAHYERNAALAQADPPPLLTDPPTNTTKPPTPNLIAQTWPIQSKLIDDTIARRGLAYIDFIEELDNNTLVVIRQAYDTKLSGKGRPPRVRHVTVVPPLGFGPVSLVDPNGYYATTAGNNRFARIRGITARRRPDKPLATGRVVNLLNGEVVRITVPNPNGGARKKTNRARATAVQPTGGVNHYP